MAVSGEIFLDSLYGDSSSFALRRQAEAPAPHRTSGVGVGRIESNEDPGDRRGRAGTCAVLEVGADGGSRGVGESGESGDGSRRKVLESGTGGRMGGGPDGGGAGGSAGGGDRGPVSRARVADRGAPSGGGTVGRQ